MTSQELATAVLEDLPIVTVVVNNGYLGMVNQWQSMFFDERRSHVHLTHAGARLRRARAGLRRGRVHRLGRETTSRRRSPRRSPAAAPPSSTRGSTPHEHCFPMIPAGAAALDMLEYQEPTTSAEPARESGARGVIHTLSRPRREQARRARPRLPAVRPPRLQHREPRGRPDRAARRLLDHAARELRQPAARADREADAQARQRAARPRARGGRGGRARAGADLDRGAARAAGGADGARRRLPGARRGRRAGVDGLRDRRRARGDRLVRGARPPARHPRALPHRPDRPPARLRPPHPIRNASSTNDPKGTPWRRSTAKATSASSTGKVAVVGYGSQGHAHALNLHDSGVEVRGRPARGQRLVAGGRGGGAVGRDRRRGGARARRSSRCSSPTRCSRPSTSADVAPNLEPTAARSSSRTGSTSTTGGSPRPPGTT